MADQIQGPGAKGPMDIPKRTHANFYAMAKGIAVRLRVLASKLRGVLARRASGHDFDEEMQAHLELLTERFVRQGMTRDEAHYAARRQLGNSTALKEERSDMERLVAFENVWMDLRHGARLLVRNPGFSVVALLTLGLGIGANTAIFSLVDGLLLKPLPYHDADRLVVPATIFQRYHSDRGSVAYADVLDWKAQRDLFEAVSAYRPVDVDVTGGQEPERVHALAVDEDYFRVFGSAMLFGRAFTAEENRPGAYPQAVLGYGLWMRRFGGDPGAVGRTIELGGIPVRVIGITQKDSAWPANAEIFKPLGIAVGDPQVMRRDNHIYEAIARLRSGVSVQQAQSKLTGMGGRIARQETNRAGTNWKLHRLASYIVGPALTQTVLVLFGAALFVLLIACLNVANLLLVRGASRAREVAIRNALGAGWKRLAAQFLTESALLSAAGGVVGVLAGYWGLKGLIRFAPPDVPLLDRVRVDSGVLAFTAALCFATSILAGVIPAIHTMRSAPAESFRDASRSVSGGLRSARVRGLLVISELALAIVLLTGAGLLIRSFGQMQKINPGFPTNDLLTLQISLPQARYHGPSQVVAGFRDITTALRRIPGIISASATSSLPIGGGGLYLGRVFLREAQPEPPASADTAGQWSVIEPNYFETMGIHVVQGHAFTDGDTSSSKSVIVISQSMARRMFGGANPLGRRIRSWRDENLYREIVGVTEDVRYSGLTESPENNVYVPHAQDSWSTLVVVLRTQSDPQVLLRSIQKQIWPIDNNLSISEVKTMDQIIDNELARPRFAMFLLGIFGAAALILAAIGIYGVMAYGVTQRTREIGIRMALGAERWDVMRLVGNSVFRLASAGVLCGVIGAALLTRLMKTLLFGVSPTDTRTFVVVSALLTFIALLAAYLPARRATKVDPVVTLRYE